MIKNKNGESLIGIVIGVFILSFIILGITNLLINSTDIINTYKNKRDITMLKDNTENVIKIIDTSQIKETEIFYLYKNLFTNTFEVFTGSANVGYKYIDRLGNNVDDLEGFNGNIYARTLLVERDDTTTGQHHQIIKTSIRKLIKK